MPAIKKLAFLVLLATGACAGIIRVDFGHTDPTDGNPTQSPDTNGNHWNNSASVVSVAPGLFRSGLVTTDNTPTSIGLTVSTGWKANGKQNGGLLAPDPALLGQLAIPTATEDYFYVEGANGTSATVTLSGLDPAKKYNLRLFGTRENTSARSTTYTVTAGSGTTSRTLQTSGTGIGANGYNGNNNTVITFTGVQPSVIATMELRVAVASGGFGYLGIMEIEESTAAPVIAANPPSDAATWYAQDLLDPPIQGSVLFTGSSSIRRWESLTRDFSDYHVIQRGFGGSELRGLIAITDYIVRPYRPSAIVMWEGTNDIRVYGRTPDNVNDSFKVFAGLVHAQFPTVPIFYISITPTPGGASVEAARKQTNILVKATCDADPTLHYLDVATFFEDLYDNNRPAFDALYVDDIHLNRAGYREWLRIIRPQFEAIVAPNNTPVSNPDALKPGERLFFDFGPSNSLDGDPTTAADVRGNFWNNWFPVNGGGGINSGEHKGGLVKGTGAPSGIDMTIIGGYTVNGKRNGGLFAPNPSLLGDLAVESASVDYFFSTADDLYNQGSDDTPGGFMLDGLDPALEYEFRILGSRAENPVRITEYAIYGANSVKKNLQTTGAGIGANGTYNGNDDEVTVISGIRPDAFGQVFIDQTLVQGSNSHINAMEIRVSAIQTPGRIWQELHFTVSDLNNPALEATLWGHDADPDGDGRKNRLEYSTGTNPRIAQYSAETVVSETIGGTDFFTLTFQRNLAATDTVLRAQASTLLDDFEDIADSLVSTAGQIETRKASVPINGFPNRFLRLKAEDAPAPN